MNAQQLEMEHRISDMTSAALSELRLHKKLCDVVIKVGEVEFNAHKIILCGCSSYFRTLFTGAWATSEKPVYTIPGVSQDVMFLIINYAYNHYIPLTNDNVVEVLAAADQFLIPGMVQNCCFYMEDRLCEMNCLCILRVVDFYHCPELRDKVFLYVLQHFEDIMSVSHDLPDLSVQQLVDIIKNDHLNVKSENTVFEAILRWINHQPEQRRGLISVLLPKVRLGLMTESDLQNNVLENELVMKSIKCIPILNDAVIAFTELSVQGLSNSVYSNPLIRPRLPPAILLVTGGKDGMIPGENIEAYDCRADCWINVSTEGIWRAHHGAAVLNNFVYLIGGCDHETFLNSVQKLDLLTYTWHHVASLNQSRCHVCVTVLNGCIYAMGGFNGQVYLNSVECYKPESDQWTMMAAMTSKRSGASAATLNGKVYICGGFSGRYNLTSAECYDPDSNVWTRIHPMMRCRNGLGVVAYRDQIYAVGGISNSSEQLRTAESYNPLTNRWQFVPPMHSPRSYFGIEVVDDQLYVVGGYNGYGTTQTVERFNQASGTWFGAAPMEMSRSGLSCCVLQGLNSLAENLFPRGPLTFPTEEKAAGGSI
ncbi:kelch-like protein 10 [Tautogolabrus adspersus]